MRKLFLIIVLLALVIPAAAQDMSAATCDIEPPESSQTVNMIGWTGSV